MLSEEEGNLLDAEAEALVSCLGTRCPLYGPDLGGQFGVRRGTRQHGHTAESPLPS